MKIKQGQLLLRIEYYNRLNYFTAVKISRGMKGMCVIFIAVK